MAHTGDHAVRAMAWDGCARAFACVTTGLVGELQRRHDTWPVATAALGRTASVAAMMGMMLKGDERLTVQIKGDGPLRGILVDADAQGHVRGYVEEPHVHLPNNHLGKLDVGGAVGRGWLSVTRDMGLKDVYRGTVALQTGEIGDDFTYYFAKSEQTPSVVAAGVLVDVDHTVLAAGGLILQLLPGHDESHVSAVEERLAQLQSVTDLLRAGADAYDLVRTLLPDAQFLEERPLSFRCRCSRERLAKVLRGLGPDELQDMIRRDGGAEVVCHFCGTSYHFNADELAELSRSEEGQA
ncbi:33 kDa chaperonin [Alicyclobacillus cellulosilyticus]|uniref:33 kDa chaperonin n=1 Tax=Alicyclobacillus cellulosilyticus TaxID=1003997 RepID=A0A917NL72_9BACL|nr:Hsp33 family molecular chaperone HslO [Alicyclobacillus cellulosilyticus]GGJ09045.1 33 kDa chaperonin [Alicyclobacillus cellulosilyticus]